MCPFSKMQKSAKTLYSTLQRSTICEGPYTPPTSYSTKPDGRDSTVLHPLARVQPCGRGALLNKLFSDQQHGDGGSIPHTGQQLIEGAILNNHSSLKDMKSYTLYVLYCIFLISIIFIAGLPRGLQYCIYIERLFCKKVRLYGGVGEVVV